LTDKQINKKIMHNLQIAIIAKDKIAYKGEAEAVFVPTQSGIIEVMPEHMQLVSALKAGDLIVKTAEGEKKFQISGGVLEVRTKSNVIILVDLV
jgi:F-type H+-transporting ATPase subunit epsilon